MSLQPNVWTEIVWLPAENVFVTSLCVAPVRVGALGFQDHYAAHVEDRARSQTYAGAAALGEAMLKARRAP